MRLAGLEPAAERLVLGENAKRLLAAVIVDGSTFLGESLFGWAATPAGLLERMEAAGIDRAVVCPRQAARIRARPGERRTSRTPSRAHPDRFVGFARVDPNRGVDAVRGRSSARSASSACAGSSSTRGRRRSAISAAVVDPVVDVGAGSRRSRRRRGRLPVALRGAAGRRSSRAAFPTVTFVATNGGQINISGLGQTDVELALAACPNLLLQTAGVYREDFLEGVVARFGAGGLVFASGFPLTDPRLEIRRVAWSHLDDDSEGTRPRREPLAASLEGPDAFEDAGEKPPRRNAAGKPGLDRGHDGGVCAHSHKAPSTDDEMPLDRAALARTQDAERVRREQALELGIGGGAGSVRHVASWYVGGPVADDMILD